MQRKLLLSLAGWLILSFSLSSCTIQPLAKIKARGSYHIDGITLNQVSCNNFEEACFWFRQNWEYRTGKKTVMKGKKPASQNGQPILFNQPAEQNKLTKNKTNLNKIQSQLKDEWKLDVALNYSAGPIIFQNKDKEIRYQYNLNAHFVLVNSANPSLNHKFNLNATSYYDTLDSPVVRDMQKNNAIRSSIEELVNKLADRLVLIAIAKPGYKQTERDFEINDTLINTDPEFYEY